MANWCILGLIRTNSFLLQNATAALPCQQRLEVNNDSGLLATNAEATTEAGTQSTSAKVEGHRSPCNTAADETNRQSSKQQQIKTTTAIASGET